MPVFAEAVQVIPSPTRISADVAWHKWRPRPDMDPWEQELILRPSCCSKIRIPKGAVRSFLTVRDQDVDGPAKKGSRSQAVVVEATDGSQSSPLRA